MVILLGSRTHQPTGKTFVMSKNDCESTLFVNEVNEICATITDAKSITCRPSTGPCKKSSAGGFRSAENTRARCSFFDFEDCVNSALNRYSCGESRSCVCDYAAPVLP